MISVSFVVIFTRNGGKSICRMTPNTHPFSTR